MSAISLQAKTFLNNLTVGTKSMKFSQQKNKAMMGTIQISRFMANLNSHIRKFIGVLF